jgi:hypothetical protein
MTAFDATFPHLLPFLQGESTVAQEVMMDQVHVQVLLVNHREAVEKVDVTEAVMVEMLGKKDERTSRL